MPDYGEIFCEAVEEVVKTQLRGLTYDLTQVCQIDDVSERDKGIYWVSTDTARFKAYSLVQNYEVGDTVYVTTPNNDATQQKIIIGKKVIGSQQDITYVMPFNNIKDVTGNIISGSREIGRLANSNFTGHDTLIWDSDNFETGFTRIGLQGSFRSQVSDAVEGSYGLKLVLGAKGTTDEVKEVATFYLDADDMYGNPYNFDGYYPQQKVFDISALAGFDVIRLYFYQNKDFRDRDGNPINSADSFGNPLKSNLFVNDLYICLGYDVKDVYNDGLILYSNDGKFYDETARVKTINWRFIQTPKDKKIKLITEANKLPGGYEIWLFKYNPSVAYDFVAGEGWERVIYNEEPLSNFQSYQFITDKTQQSIKYKAMIIYNGRAIYESNELEFINTVDVVSIKINELKDSFHIYPSDDMNKEYHIYTNGMIATGDSGKTRYLYPAFKNNDGELEYIQNIDRVKWIVPKTNTMINLVVPEKKSVKVSFTFPNDSFNSLEEYLKTQWATVENVDDLPNYYEYKDNYYVYFFKPDHERGLDQRIAYKIKENLNNNNTRNTIQCAIEHNNKAYSTEATFSFGEKTIPNYNVELSFDTEEDGFSLADWNENAGAGIQKKISARFYASDGTELTNFTSSWNWYNPEVNDPEKEGEYYNPFTFQVADDNKNAVCVSLKEQLSEVPIQYAILQCTVTKDTYEYYGYLSIKFWKLRELVTTGVVEKIQPNETYTTEVTGRYPYQTTLAGEEIDPWYSQGDDAGGDKSVGGGKTSTSRDESEEEEEEPDYASGDFEYDNSTPITLSIEIVSTYANDVYQPRISEDNQLITPSTVPENLKALYCYIFRDENNEIKMTVPAFIYYNKERINKEEIKLPTPPSNSEAEPATTFSLRRAAVATTAEENPDSYTILKSDLSSGKLENKTYSGVVIGQVQKNNDEPKYGVYGFQNDKLKFAIDQSGGAYFGGELRGASGSFEGTLTAGEGSVIGGWTITENGLESSGQSNKKISFLAGDDPKIILGSATLSASGLSQEGNDIFNISNTNINDALLDLEADYQEADKTLIAEIQKLDKIVNILIENQITPSWQEIEYIADINFENKTFTKKKIKVLATGAPVDIE